MILFQIVSFVAAPTHRASVICHQVQPLCQSAQRKLQYNSNTLWEAVLHNDYGGTATNIDDHTASKRPRRRSCPRLARSSLERVRDAHRLVRDNTELAFYYLSELVSTATFSKSKLVSLLHEYGPHLRINQRTASGGLFLVEVTRARKVKEAVILKCVQELVENHGAMVDLQTYESVNAHQTALSVAAARAMPTVLKYLLDHGASREIRCSGRFRLHKNARKSVQLVELTSLECARRVSAAETEYGATASELRDLSRCIDLLNRCSSVNQTP
jgi:hypothetical protein